MNRENIFLLIRNEKSMLVGGDAGKAGREGRGEKREKDTCRFSEPIVAGIFNVAFFSTSRKRRQILQPDVDAG